MVGSKLSLEVIEECQRNAVVIRKAMVTAGWSMKETASVLGLTYHEMNNALRHPEAGYSRFTDAETVIVLEKISMSLKLRSYRVDLLCRNILVNETTKTTPYVN